MKSKRSEEARFMVQTVPDRRGKATWPTPIAFPAYPFTLCRKQPKTSITLGLKSCCSTKDQTRDLENVNQQNTYVFFFLIGKNRKR